MDERLIERLETTLAETIFNSDNHLVSIRERTFQDGSVHYVRQCQKCGRQIEGPLKKTDKNVVDNFQNIKPFDEELSDKQSVFESNIRDSLFRAKNEITASVESESESTLKYEQLTKQIDIFLSDLEQSYSIEYIESEMLRRLRIKKKQNVSYEHSYFKSEPEAQSWLVDYLSQDFEIWNKSKGRHISEGKGVEIDLIIYPKQHLIDRNFITDYIGIEVKCFHPDKKFSRKSSRAWWQTISYLDSVFFIDGEKIKPKFCLLFSNLSFHGEDKHLKDDHGICWRAFKQLANHARIGSLDIDGTVKNEKGWSMKFAGRPYFWKRKQKDGTVNYSNPNHNLIEKVRIGNF